MVRRFKFKVQIFFPVFFYRFISNEFIPIMKSNHQVIEKERKDFIESVENIVENFVDYFVDLFVEIWEKKTFD